MRYLHVVVRFVPNPTRGEFINVGAIVGCDATGEWDMRMVSNGRRARKLDDRDVLKALWIVADDIGRRIDHYNDSETLLFDEPEVPTEAWLERLWSESNNVVQFSRPTPISAENTTEALDFIFRHLIVDVESAGLSYKRRTGAVAAIRHAYSETGLKRGSTFLENYIVRTRHYHEKFDFVVANGSAVQITQAWSFQIPNQSDLIELVKAYAFTVRDLRRSGGSATFGDYKVNIPANVDIAAVFIGPQEGGATIAFDEAKAAFADGDVRVRLVPMVDVVSDLAVPARDLLAGAH